MPGHHNPSFWWIQEAQESAAQGRWRLRHVGTGTPAGEREIRRTAPYRWWLIAVGWGRARLTGEPLGYAIERGALLADPLLLALLLAGGAGYCARFFGPLAAAGLVAGGIALFPLAANFQPGAPDPHSLAWVLALGSLLPLLAPSARTGARERWHFAAAGVLGGLGFWNDAPSQAPVLLAVALGALGAGWCRARPAGRAAGPRPWRTWAAAGALTTLAAAVFEFAPGHFSWSLDAVHPVHALAWWGLGEGLHAAERWFREGRRAFGPRSFVLLGLAGLALAAWPAAGIASGSGTLLAADFNAIELANHPRGGAASSLGAWLGRADAGARWATLLPVAFVLFLLVRTMAGRLDGEERGRLVQVLVVVIGAGVLACLQLRWWNLFDVGVLAGLAVFFAGAENGGMAARLGRAAALLPVLPGLLVGFPAAVRDGAVEPTPPEAQVLIARDLAWWLVQRGGPEPGVLFSTPVVAGAAAYYGGFAAVASADGTDEAGQQAAVRIASAVTEQEVAVLLKSRRVTHVALPLWDPVLDQLVRLGQGVPAGQPLPRNAFAVALREWDMPLWMRPMDYLIPREPGFEGFELRVFAVQAEQEPDLSLGRLADFFVERGQLREAQGVRESLKAWPRSPVALGAMAGVDLAVRDGARLKESLDALVPMLARRTARNLPADRRISLAALFLRTRQPDLAREQLAAAFDGLDSATLRTLTPGTLVNLVALSRSLGVPFPDPGLETLALDLIPPGVRAGLGRK